MDFLKYIKLDLQNKSNKEKAAFFPKFFKTKKGEYGENDKFIGVIVPDQRKIAKEYYKEISLKEIEKLLQDPIHEYRVTALFIIIEKYEKSKIDIEKTNLTKLYIKNIKYVNNWDLVDLSAPKILGPFFNDTDKKDLYKYANSKNLWEQRISILTTFYFIRKKQYDDTLKIAKILLNHKHDLIHKAVGWMLREIGNRDMKTELTFLKKHYTSMPRTMLRYAIEKFDEDLRQKFLKGEI